MAFAQTYPHLLALAHKKLPAFLEELARYVNIDTGTGYDEGLTRMAHLLQARLEGLGARVTLSKFAPEAAGYNLRATWQGKGNGKLLCFAHADTVWLVGTATQRPFTCDGKTAWGPGVSDCKSGIVAVIYALELLREVNFTDFAELTFLVNADEERSSKFSREFIRSVAREGFDLALCCEAGKARDDIIIERKGSGQLYVRIYGKSSHAGSAPEKGRNALMELCHQLLQMKGMEDLEAGTTVNFTQVKESQNRHNVIPDYAEAVASVRAKTQDEFARIEAEAEALAQRNLVPEIKVVPELYVGRPPMAVNAKSHRLVKFLQALYQKELDRPLGIGFSGGASDANLLGDICPVLDSMGPVGGNAHGVDEYLDVTSIVPRLYLLARVFSSAPAIHAMMKEG